jgi:uncharacterized alkaline shock family protein YloU
MNNNISSEYGKIKIHRRVFRQIAETAASEVKGVVAVGWGCYGAWEKFLKFFSIAGTKVCLESEPRIVIPIAVVWDVDITNVAYEVQKKIISQMLASLNIESLIVDVKVKRVERRKSS